MRDVLAQLLTLHDVAPNRQRRSRVIIVLAIGMILVGILFVPVTLVFQDDPRPSLIVDATGIALFSTSIVLARRGDVTRSAFVILLPSILCPLAAILAGRLIATTPFVLVFSVLLASQLLRPWQIWLVLLVNLFGLACTIGLLLATGYAPTGFEPVVIIISAIMLPTVALISFLGAYELQRERAALIREITERKRTEAALSLAKDAAEATSRTKSTFLAHMSHEFRTPLTTILGYTDLISLRAQRAGDSSLTADLATIQKACDHLLMLINDVLDLSKIEAGKLDLTLETFSIAALIQDVIIAVRPMAERNGNALETHYADDLGTMYADQTKVRQVLLNLLSNAAKFTERGTITLSATREVRGDTAWISFRIADTGIGISEEQFAGLFQIFVQADMSMTRKYGGTGLGLALSQRLCRLMGGDITVVSAVGVGSTFTAYLPARINREAAEPAPVLAGPPPDASALRLK